MSLGERINTQYKMYEGGSKIKALAESKTAGAFSVQQAHSCSLLIL